MLDWEATYITPKVNLLNLSVPYDNRYDMFESGTVCNICRIPPNLALLILNLSVRHAFKVHPLSL